VDPEVATPDKRRSLIGGRIGRWLLIGGAFVFAVVAVVVVATIRAPRETAQEAPVQRVNEPVIRERTQPTVVQPLWTTGVADRAVRDIVATDDVVVVNTGRAIGALEPSSGEMLWTRGSAARITDLVVVRDVAVAATADGLSGYDVATGDRRWESDDGTVVPEALAIGRREIFAATRDASGIAISTIDPRNGAVEPLGAIGSDPDPTAGRITLDFDRSARSEGGHILYLLTPRGLHAFDPSAGAEIWRAPVDIDGGLDGPALRDRPWVRSLEAVAGAAFVVGRDGAVCRYAAENGEEVWTTCQQFPADLATGPSLYAKDARVVVASPDAIAAFDYTNGLPQWSRTQADELQPSLAGSPGLTYVARDDGVVRAFDHGSGLERWRAQDVGSVSALLADDDGVYVGAEGGGVVRLAQQALGGSDNR
jgi:outer membrane protein assembly factor BamB